MKAMDLTKLVEGLLILIFAAVAVGHYGDLRAFAAREAAASLRGWDTHAFFPATYRRVMATPPKGQVHLKGAARAGAPSHPDQPHFQLKGDYSQ